MRIGSLFSGIGGLELGLEWAGIGHTVWQVERDEFCQRVLARHWPDAERFDDVCTVGAATLAPVDLICGGFPCQDISSAGKGEGVDGSRSGLWFEYRRIIDEMRPEWVVIENVASGGNRWVDAITSQLGELGYGSIPFPLSAFDVGAPHLRKRIFVVAHAHRIDGREGWPGGAGSRSKSWRPVTSSRAIADADSERPQARNRELSRQERTGRAESRGSGWAPPPDPVGEQLREQQGRSSGTSRPGETESQHDGGTRIASDRDRDREPTLAGDDSQVAGLREYRGDSPSWPAPPEIRPVDDGISRRMDQLRALGNAVVPQCAEVVGHIIRQLGGF